MSRQDGDYQVWVEFFDDVYRELYATLLHPVRTEFEVAALVRLLALGEGQRVLDLCCGDGRHAVPLQRRGMQVTAVDLALPMVSAARARARRVLNEEDPQPVFIRADCGQLPVRPLFDAALLLYNSISFGSRSMTCALFANAHAALKPGAKLLVECTHRDHEARAAMASQEVEEIRGPAGTVQVTRRFDPDRGEQHARMLFIDAAGTTREKHLRYLVYTAGEIREMLGAAGFSSVELFGGYDERAFGVETPAVFRATR